MKHLFPSTLLIIPLLSLSACNGEEKEITAQAKAVKTIVVGGVDGMKTRKLSGVVQAADESELSFRVSGRITEVKVERGDAVERGDVLARLEQKDYVLSVNSAKAKLQSAHSELTTAKQENSRQQNLLKENFVSKAAAEQAQAAYQNALSKVEVAKTDLQTAEANLERTILHAPFAGKISAKEIEAFGEIKIGETAFLLQGSDGLEVEILVPETIIREIEQGGAAVVTFPTLQGVNTAATITQIGARSESGNAFPVTLRLAAGNADIRPGMTADAAIAIDNAKSGIAFLIPTSAVAIRFFDRQTDLEQSHVFVVDSASSTLKLKRIAVSGVRGNQLEITSGLSAGDRIVVAGVPFLSEGQKVKLWEPQYSIPATLGK